MNKSKITDDMHVVRPSHEERRLGYWMILISLCMFFGGLYWFFA